MSFRNTCITLVAGLMLAISLWGLSRALIPATTTAYRVDVQAAKPVDDAIELTTWSRNAPAGSLGEQLSQMEDSLKRVEESYNRIKSEFGWTQSFEQLVAGGSGQVSAALTSSMKNTAELEQQLKEPEKLLVAFPEISFDTLLMPRPKDVLGEEWVWIDAGNEGGFWIHAKERDDAPTDVDFKQLVKIKSQSPTKEQWLLAHGLKPPSLQQMDDGKAEFLQNGMVIGGSDHLISQKVTGFNPLIAMQPAERTGKTLGNLNMPAKPAPPPKPAIPPVDFKRDVIPFSQKSYADLYGDKWKVKWNNDSSSMDTEKVQKFKDEWTAAYRKNKEDEIDKAYKLTLKDIEDKFKVDIEAAKERQPKEDSFAYRWIILPG